MFSTLMKTLVKAINREKMNCNRYVKQKFPNITNAKTKNNTSIEPQIKLLIKDTIRNEYK